MWRSFAKTTLRALCRDWAYTVINIVGLAIGMACCILLGVYLYNELTYDQHHENHDRVYRVAIEFTIDGRANRFALSSAYLGPVISANYPEIEAFVRIQPLAGFTAGGGLAADGERFIRHGNMGMSWADVYAADSSIFDVFTHDIVFGDERTALSNPDSVAVSQSFAQKYFGDANPLGKILTFDGGEQKTVTLVFADLPDNTHLKYDVLLPYDDLPTVPADSRWFWSAETFTYLLLPENYAVASFDSISSGIFERYMTDHANYLNGTWRAWLEPLADIHYSSKLDNDRPSGNRHFLYGLVTAGAFILLIACINYVNLTTARATTRSKEIRVRKLLGASRWSLGLQFLAEAVLLSFIALIVAVFVLQPVLAFTSIPQLLGGSVTLAPDEFPGAFAIVVGSTLLVGILSGIYPALYLSSSTPLTAPSSARSGNTRVFREVLVLVQFTASIAIVACTAIMVSQLKFVGDLPLGFEKENRLVVTLRGLDVIERIPSLRNELKRDPGVLEVTATDYLVGITTLNTFFETENNDGEMVSVTTHMMPVAGNYIEAMGMDIVAGRDFSPEEPRNSTIIVNEAVVRYMGWDEPIGKLMGRRGRTVIGVVGDFNFKSLHEPVQPIAIYQYRSNFDSVREQDRPFEDRYLIVHVAPENLDRTLGFMEKTLADFGSVHPFRYRFLEDILDELYSSEERLIKIVSALSMISVLVACLGLLGLTAFSTAQRTKEIGIRRVLGATTAEIVLLLNRRILVLVLLGALIASFTAHVVMDAWLYAFAHRMSIGPGVFVISTAVVLGAAFAAGAMQSIRAAQGHPVTALRYE